jgi:hypothetical protein
VPGKNSERVTGELPGVRSALDFAIGAADSSDGFFDMRDDFIPAVEAELPVELKAVTRFCHGVIAVLSS